MIQKVYKVFFNLSIVHGQIAFHSQFKYSVSIDHIKLFTSCDTACEGICGGQRRKEMFLAVPHYRNRSESKSSSEWHLARWYTLNDVSLKSSHNHALITMQISARSENCWSKLSVDFSTNTWSGHRS